MRSTHREGASRLQRALDRVTAIIGSSLFVVFLVAAIVVWMLGNLAATLLGLGAPDAPPFVWLELATSVSALLVACVILSTQRREDKLADHRNHLVLELAVANDQKVAKIIQLIEESRRDNPVLANRVDVEAAQMATPSNAVEVLEVIRDLSDGDT